MNTDSVYQIGSTHKVCEDYALSFSSDKTGIACIADGCSSSKDTDFGARLILQTYLEKRKHSEDRKEALNRTIETLWALRRIIGFDLHVFDSTFLDIEVHSLGFKSIGFIGDGAYCYLYDDILYIRVREAKDNLPFYISYLSGKIENIEEIRMFEKTYRIDFKTKECLDHTEIVGGEDNLYYNYTIIPRTSDFGLVFSDGITSVLDNKNQRIDPVTTIVEFVKQLKRFNGTFIQRGMIGFNKICKKNEWTHYDDLSVAGIHF